MTGAKNKHQTKISIRSLNLIFIRNGDFLSKATISDAFLLIEKENIVKAVNGRLKSLSLKDLTKYGHVYTEKFSTTGPEALSFSYTR